MHAGLNVEKDGPNQITLFMKLEFEDWYLIIHVLYKIIYYII